MAESISLEQYEEAERVMAVEGSRRGLTIHAVITLAVSVALVVVNIVVAPQFPWSAFAVVGMGIGLVVHYWFGYRELDATMRQHQRAVEGRAGLRLERES